MQRRLNSTAGEVHPLSPAEEVLGAARLADLRSLCAGTWEGTEEVTARLVRESMHNGSWRPIRAAALLTAHDAERDRVWMTAEEFRVWLDRQRKLATRLKLAHPLEDLEMSRNRAKDLQTDAAQKRRGTRVSKVEALACAHLALGLPKPLENGDTDAFYAYFMARFGVVGRVAEFLHINPENFTDRLRGWSIVRGERVARPVEGYFIRALDWLWSVGPLCPYGVRPPVALWPSQETPS